MKIIDCKITKKEIQAKIRLSFFNSKTVIIPTINMMYMFSDPKEWDNVDKVGVTENFEDFSNLLMDMIDNNNETVSEVILKVAGEHPNSYENEFFRKMLNDRSFAIQQSDFGF